MTCLRPRQQLRAQINRNPQLHPALIRLAQLARKKKWKLSLNAIKGACLNFKRQRGWANDSTHSTPLALALV
jgi:hypothetical protein